MSKEKMIIGNKGNLNLDDIEGYQIELLKKQLRRLIRESNFYREKFKDVEIEAIKTYKDLTYLPFLTRKEIEENALDLFCKPTEEIAQVSQTSGTTAGRPLIMAHTYRDIEKMSLTKKREFEVYGLTPSDVIQISLNYNFWQGAWSSHWGAQALRGFILPAAGSHTARQIDVMIKLKTTALIATPNYLLRIANYIEENNYDLNLFNVKFLISVAGRLSNSGREYLKKIFPNAKIFIDYGATEFPTFCYQCQENSNFHHVWYDLYLIEIIDPLTGKQLPPGKEGELVVTNLFKEASPVIRYRTRDITKIQTFTDCHCPYPYPVISGNIKRLDNMVKVRGTLLFPEQFESIAEKMENLSGKVQLLVEKSGHIEEVTLIIECLNELPKETETKYKNIFLNYSKNFIGLRLKNVEFKKMGFFPDKYKKVLIKEEEE